MKSEIVPLTDREYEVVTDHARISAEWIKENPGGYWGYKLNNYSHRVRYAVEGDEIIREGFSYSGLRVASLNQFYRIAFLEYLHRTQGEIFPEPISLNDFEIADGSNQVDNFLMEFFLKQDKNKNLR